MTTDGVSRPALARRATSNLLSLLLFLVAAGCTPTAQDRSEADREAELTLRSLMAAFESADEALIEDLFVPQATYDDFPNQHTYYGVEEIVGYVTAVHQWADDVYMNVGAVYPTRDGAVAEWVFSGVQNRPLGDRVPVGTGREVVLNGVTIIQMQGGRIVRAADYTDTGALMLQLGGRIDLPGGGVVELDSIR